MAEQPWPPTDPKELRKIWDLVDKIMSQRATRGDEEYPPRRPPATIDRMPGAEEPRWAPPARARTTSYIAPGHDPEQAKYFTPGFGGAIMRGPAYWDAIKFAKAISGGPLQRDAQPLIPALSSLRDVIRGYGQGFRQVTKDYPIRPAIPLSRMEGVPSQEAWSNALRGAGGINNLQVRRMLGFGQ